jgi:hypothetical protein
MAIIGNIGGSVMQPNQLVEGEYTEENYKEMLRWIGLQYNQASNSIPINAAGLPQPSGYINEYLENLTYIYGAQTPANYSFFIKDAVGNNTAAPLFRGLDVFKIFSYLHGEAVDLIEPLPKILNATAYSIGAISAKKEMMDFVKFVKSLGYSMPGVDSLTNIQINALMEKVKGKPEEKPPILPDFIPLPKTWFKYIFLSGLLESFMPLIIKGKGIAAAPAAAPAPPAAAPADIPPVNNI